MTLLVEGFAASRITGRLMPGVAYQRGTVLGRQSRTGAYIKSVRNALDGSELPIAILAEDANTLPGMEGTCRDHKMYLQCVIRSNLLVYDSSWEMSNLKLALSGGGIMILD